MSSRTRKRAAAVRRSPSGRRVLRPAMADACARFGRESLRVRQIEHFVAAVEFGSLSGAAEAAGISVQGMSQSIAGLEEEVGAQLLERGRLGTSPTAFGWECYDRAKDLLAEFDDFDSFVRSQSSPDDA